MLNCVGKMEVTFEKAVALNDAEKRVLKAHKHGQIKALQFLDMINEALALAVITEEEARLLIEFEYERQEIIAVDDFDTADLKLGRHTGHKN